MEQASLKTNVDMKINTTHLTFYLRRYSKVNPLTEVPFSSIASLVPGSRDPPSSLSPEGEAQLE